MDEILTVIKAVEPVGIAILIWRSRVADKERAELMREQTEIMSWLQGLLTELMHEKKGGG